MNCSIKRHLNIEKWDWLLIIGLVFAPMTSLRIGKVGPGEVLCRWINKS
jgi:hypothetical protein